MTVVEPTAEDLFVGLGKRAETHLSAAWVARRQRAGGATLTGLVVLVQLAWVIALGYAAYHFVA